MPPRRRASSTPPPLTDDDVALLRSRVATGEKPRVVVRSASAAVAAGTRGTVVRFGDPHDNEYVVVRLGRDEVPFAPNELSLTGRAGGSAAVAPPPAPSKPVPVEATPAARPARVTPSRKAAATRARPDPRRGSRRGVPPLVVTMRFKDGDWSVEAQRGNRRLSRPGPLKPGAVSAFADHVDDPAVRDALTETVQSCREVVEERAAALRAELEAAEAALRDYDAKPGRR